MRVKFNFAWDTPAMSESDYLKLRAVALQWSPYNDEVVSLPHSSDEKAINYMAQPRQLGTMVADVVALRNVLPHTKIELNLGPSHQLILADLVEQFQILAAKLTSPPAQVNERLGVHMPGNGLLRVSELRLQNNCCTDVINEHLKEGWRIVAVCPQPDQRRPDYILGKFNERATDQASL